MKLILRRTMTVATIVAFALLTGCASTLVAGPESSEGWYDEHPVAGVLTLPVDLALGIPLHLLGFLAFLVVNPELPDAALAGSAGQRGRGKAPTIGSRASSGDA